MTEMRDVILGACVGDAVGGPVEFIKRFPISEELCKNAFRMKGGGFLDLAPGQISDDGELTICLAIALMNSQDPMRLYARWLASEPIDVGITIRHAILHATPCETSQSNGALMRCSVIGAFYCKTASFAKIADLARKEARNTHLSEICQECNAVYCVAIAHLLVHKNAREAISEAKKHTKNTTVLQWLKDSLCADGSLILEMTQENIGWVRWGFTLAFYHLFHGHSYQEAIEDVVRQGGDTDTNATITGAMMGAFWGADAIPAKWLQKVARCRVRPAWLRPAQFMGV